MSNYFKHKMRGKNPATIAAMIVFGGAAITGLAILFGFVIMWLWNWLMPEIFDLPPLSYWQAVGLFILAKIIFGGFGSGHSSKHKSRHSSSSCEGRHKKKKDFSKWAHYDKFWEEKGDQAYTEYVEGLDDAVKSDKPEEISE